MLVIDWSQFLEKGLPLSAEFSKTAMTIGVFDGVHRGHQSLIQRVVSHNASYVPAIITFRENHKNSEKTNIQTFEERLEIFEQLGVEITLAIDFTESFRRMKGSEFLKILFKRGGVCFFAVGKSFRCGCDLDTSADDIKNFFASRGVQTEIVPEVTEGSLPVSSSRIRAAIANGDFQLAQKMLGRAIAK